MARTFPTYLSPGDFYANWEEDRPPVYVEWAIPATSTYKSGIRVIMTPTGTVSGYPIIAGLDIDIDDSGSPDLTESIIYAARICVREMGAVGYAQPLTLENYQTTANANNAFIMMRNQGSGVLGATFNILGTNKPDYLVKMQTAGASGMLEIADITSGKSCVAGLRCIYGSTVGVIPLYAD